MIGYLTGKIVLKKPTKIILDVSGVGYLINISISTFEKIPDETETVALFTYLNVKEDALDLYGFWTIDEKEMFELLISVSGIGPKIAQSILSAIQIDDLKESLKFGNLSRLTATPGVGRKTAERMILELKDKIDSLDQIDVSRVSGFSIKNDAVLALTNLGYNQKTATNVIRQIMESKPSITIEELVKNALIQLNKQI
ncbi:MAG: Holliday junction branch migration protein RuvA [Ignavibacteriales bacterium CG_4_9_14_3_um_filter_34_10]|nr:MAG: Holliday junction branch migration protein RuvA [Ignavibacteriales bacterium CG_4_9_14_3_um_filter_34_10]